ncbi:MAG TPA: hypothetical protein VMC02_07275 [Steroidobacteraceae bacterium]|nr:hypothetical protein [Steroidobacteraceae bacterium]
MPDVVPLLREALLDLEAAGLAVQAQAARDRCFAACATSSEWLGEVGVALTGLLAACGPSIPPSTREKLRTCLKEVAKVWPRFRMR